MNFDSDHRRQYLNLGAILAAFFTNVLANIKPLDGLTIAEISKQYFDGVLLLPASYAFSIWGLIYLGLISLGVYQALPHQKENPHCQKLGYALVWSSLAQIIWVALFQYRYFVPSLGMIGLVLLPLAFLSMRLYKNPKPLPKKARWFLQIPVSIYFAWVTVATIVNAACVLDFIGWQGFGVGDIPWTIILLIVGTVLAGTVTLRQRNLAYGGVFVWAWVAIAVKNSAQGLIPLVAMITAALLLGLCVAVWRIPHRLPFQGTR